METGTVIGQHRETYAVRLDESGREVAAQLRYWEAAQDSRRREELSRDGENIAAQQVAVGDRVQVSEDGAGQGIIEQIEERRTVLGRKSGKRFQYRYQVLAANADQLAVVVSRPRIAVGFIDRCLLAARLGGLQPLLVANKVDIDPEVGERPEVRVYRDLGLPVHITSALEGTGLDELGEALRGRSTVLCGLSGTGKSSLLARLTGEEIRVGDVRRTGTGKQTTVGCRLYQLPAGGSVIDTPGVRVFGLAGLTEVELRAHFSEIVELAAGCGFRDCTHSHEPDCAVRRALEQGLLLEDRVTSYQKLLRECAGHR